MRSPIATETGLASWYGPPYHNRRGSNGEVYNMHAMTAAHRTYPLGSIVRVTNVKTGHSALVRITDRGPFIPGRVLDLSLAAARKLDVWQPGVARSEGRVDAVRVSRFPGKVGRANRRISPRAGGEQTRRSPAAPLSHGQSAVLSQAPPETGGCRVRVLDDDHDRAQKLAAETETPEGSVFLVRLD
jgi:rare lipoprotein A